MGQEILEDKALRITAQLAVAAAVAKSFYDSTHQHLSALTDLASTFVSSTGLDNYNHLILTAPSIKLAAFTLIGYCAAKGTGLFVDEANRTFHLGSKLKKIRGYFSSAH